MRTTGMRLPLAGLVALAALGGCESEEPTTLRFNTLKDGAMVDPAADAEKTLDVDFSVGFFRLKFPGTCPIDKQCGHVVLDIDGEACRAPDPDNPGAKLAYNNRAPGALPPPPPMTPPPNSPIKARFAHCPTYAGEHTIRLTLKNDDGRDVPGGGKPATFVEVKVMVRPKPAPAPSIKITAPLTGATVMPAVDPDKSVDVAFAVTGLTLMAPGSCGMTPGCGHVHVRVDGTDCNERGKIFNNEGAASPVKARLALCPQASGMHVIKLSLHDDLHADIPATGETAASVVVNVP